MALFDEKNEAGFFEKKFLSPPSEKRKSSERLSPQLVLILNNAKIS
ncbi:MAG: hypothetical protein ACO1O1_15600 [Adhaeribacter sp.]